MAIELIKAPGGVDLSGAAYAQITIEGKDFATIEPSGNYILPEGSIFTFVTGLGTFTLTTADDIISSFPADIMYEVKAQLTTLLGSNYALSLVEVSAEIAQIVITGLVAGTPSNFSSVTLPTHITLEENIEAFIIRAYPLFAKNDYDFIYQTDAYITAAAALSRTDLLVAGKPIALQHLTLFNADQTLDFLFTNSPTTAETEELRLLSYTGSETNTQQAQVIIDGLKRNYYIDTNYNVFLESVALGVAKIRIEGKTPTISRLNLTSTPSNITQHATVVDGAAATYADNYRMFLDVYTQNGVLANKVLPLDGLPDDSQMVNFRSINKDLKSLIPFNLPTYSTGSGKYELGNYVAFYTKLCDYFGAPARERLYKQLPATNNFIMLNGAAAQSRITDNYLLPYFTDTVKFLTNMLSSQVVLSPTQLQWLSAYINKATGITTLLVRIKMYYTDGTSSADTTALTTTANGGSIVTITCGYGQLGISALKAADKTVAKYEVWLSDGSTILTEKFTFKLDYSFYRNSRYFLFSNSYGQAETIWIRGAQAVTIEVSATEQQLAFNNRNETTKLYNGARSDANIMFDASNKIASGTRAKWELDYFKDFLAAENKYQVLADKYMAITCGRIKVDIGNDDDTLFTFDFSYTIAAEERGNA